jgi:type VI secretion system secreted protein VgrG
MALSCSDEEIVIKTGEASFVMKKDGSVLIKGKHINVEGSGRVEVKAAGKLTLKGQSIQQN